MSKQILALGLAFATSLASAALAQAPATPPAAMPPAATPPAAATTPPPAAAPALVPIVLPTAPDGKVMFHPPAHIEAILLQCTTDAKDAATPELQRSLRNKCLADKRKYA